MSRDDPFGGGGGKTVIRPNPGGGGGGGFPNPGGGGGFPNPGGGGGFPNPGGGGVPNPGGARPMPGGFPPGGGGFANPAPPPAQWPPAGGGQQGYNPRVNAPAYNPNPQGVGGMPQGGGDDWLRGPSAGAQFPTHHQPVAPAHDAPKIPLEIALNARDGGEISAANPITAAAAPLLILLGRLRLQIVELQAAPLMAHVANEIIAFERRCLEAGVDPTDVRVAKYALCGTADDIIQNLPGPDKHVWLQYSMLAQFFQVRTSGVGFYEELAKIMHNPAPKYNLLELMHACLSLGFEGQYRGSPNGANELARIRRDVYQTLRHLKGRADDDISPRWKGLELKMQALNSRVPLWAIACAAAGLLVAAFFVLRVLLGQDADVLADRLIALNPSSPVTLERASTFVPAVIKDTRDQSQLERVRQSLGVVDDSCVAADMQGDEIVIKVCNVLLFASGSATVRKEFADLAKRIADGLKAEPGQISIVGYTDNVKPSGVGKYKSNFDLSVARAKAVEVLIAENLEDKTRIKVEGRGELNPIADNSTPEGRSQNRRVEIMIPRQETLTQ